jgi:hypothetical protein
MNYQKEKAKCINCGTIVKRRPNIYCSTYCQYFYKLHRRFLENPNNMGSSALRSYLMKVRGEVCEICKLSEWLGEKIPLELDHISGNWADNFDDNIRLLCPNCHAQTPTWKNKNRGNGRQYRASIAQLVEHHICNMDVGCSIHPRGSMQKVV